jgi:hypothetical protein
MMHWCLTQRKFEDSINEFDMEFEPSEQFDSGTQTNLWWNFKELK